MHGAALQHPGVGRTPSGLHAQYPPFDFTTTAADPGGHAAAVRVHGAGLDGRNRLTCALRIIWMIPAAIVTFLILIVAVVCWLIGAIAVLFTGAWPEGLRAWVLKGLRASLRLSAYQWLLTDEYPPLSFELIRRVSGWPCGRRTSTPGRRGAAWRSARHVRPRR